MYEVILESLGLSPNESKIYEALIIHGESSISGTAVNAKVHRRNAYDAMERLINKGLCFQIFSSGENRYNAVDPEKLLEIVSDQREQIRAVLPEMQKKFETRSVSEEAYIYRGLEGQKNIWRDLLRVGGESYFIGAKGGWFDKRIETSRIAFFKEAKQKGISFIQLFDHVIKVDHPNFPKEFPGKLRYRFLPKEHATNSAIHIFGDYVITYTGLPIKRLSEDIVFFVIRSKNLAESYRSWFWYMWKQSSPK